MEHLYEQIDALSLDEFEALLQYVDKMRMQRAKTILAEAQKKASRLTQDIDGTTTKRSKTKPPKYRDPNDPNNTWSGYGRQPDWMKEHIDAGGDKSDLLI